MKIFADAHQVQCSPDWMKVSIVLPPQDAVASPAELASDVYLEGMKGYPNEKCQPDIVDNIALFRLSLKDFYQCGVTRIVNKLTVISYTCLMKHVNIYRLKVSLYIYNFAIFREKWCFITESSFKPRTQKKWLM